MESKNLLELKRKSMSLGLCEIYKKKWDECESKKELIDMALDANGIEYLADFFSFGWGLSPEYILKEFHDYINGAYQRSSNGYTGELFVLNKKTISVRSTLNLLVECDCTVIVPASVVCKIYVCGGSVTIENHGVVDVFCYGDTKEPIFTEDDSRHLHRSTCVHIQHSLWIPR